MNKLLVKFLWGNRKPLQIFTAGLGFMAGLFIVLISVQIFIGINHILEPVKSQSSDGDFLIINKNITVANTLGLSASGFTSDEIAEVEKQPFVKKVGLFKANQFQSYGTSNTTIPFGTVLFFESVPDEYLDKKPAAFKWHPGDNVIPILLSQDFLNLYNFGFALSQGLPQLSKQAIQLVPLTIEISGKHGKQQFQGKIVGFTDRFSTVLVPMGFMDWANVNIGENRSRKPSRLVLKVNNSTSPEIASFLESKGYQTNSDKLKMGKASAVIKLVTGLIGLIGFLFICLSFVLFTTNFRAIIAEAKTEISLLLQLGYTSNSISNSLLKRFYALIVILASFSFALVWFANMHLHNFLKQSGLETDSGISWQVIVLGLSFTGASILINSISVLNLVRKLR